ncbi:hypothetical protein Vpro01_02961 [Vibrio proteolyticus]
MHRTDPLFSTYIQYRYLSQNCSWAESANGLYLSFSIAVFLQREKRKTPRSNLLLRGELSWRLYSLTLLT